MKLSRVICLVRGDESDTVAIDTAIGLLNGNQRSIRFAFVIEMDRRYSLETTHPRDVVHAEQVLRNAQSYVSELRGLSVRGAILQARSVAPVLIREALDFGAQAIVAASRISTTFAGKEIDEDSQYLMAHAPCAVVLVRKPASDQEQMRDTVSARRLNARANLR